MKKLVLGAAFVALATLPAAAPAQKLSPAVVAVVDVQRISNDCTACRAASAQLDTQIQQLQQRAQQLQTPIQTEGNAIQAAVNALAGKQPDPALKARVAKFEAQQNSARQELGNRESQIRSIQAHVNQQIGQRLLTVANQIMGTRGATIVMDKGSALAVSPSIDITADVLAALNQQLPSVSVTPLPQQAQQQAPQGR